MSDRKERFIHGIHFIIKNEAIYKIPLLPSNYEMYENNVGVNIIYHFKYYPVSWSNWNKIAQIRASIQRLIPEIEWREYDHEDHNVKCIESDFKNIMQNNISFYKSPQVMNSYKHEVRRVLGIECKNLWYQNYFFIEKVIAFSLWLSQTYKSNKYINVSNREAVKRAWSAYYGFDKIKHEYSQRLSTNDRKEAYAKRNTLTKTKSFKGDVLKLLSEGVSNKEIMNKYNVTRQTLSVWKKETQ